MKKQAESWLQAAHDDLLVIQEIIENNKLTHMVAFHSQQVIEKSFKAVLELNNEKIPKTHNLILLKDRIEKYIQLDIDTNIFDQINELYIDSRYPTDIGILPEGKPSTQNARDFFCFAQKLYDNTQDIINKSI